MSVRDALHRLVDALPDRELRLAERLLRAGSLPESIDLDALIAQQGLRPITDRRALSAGVWPEDESVDDFLAAREAWRREDEGA